MTEFERQVAEALCSSGVTVGSVQACQRCQAQAPRVAAAIDRARESVAERLQEAVLASAEGRPLADPAVERENVRRDALAVLRGGG